MAITLSYRGHGCHGVIAGMAWALVLFHKAVVFWPSHQIVGCLA